jgi:uncharacterized protein YggE
MTALRLPIVMVATLLPALVQAQAPRGLPVEPLGPTIAVSGAAEIRVVPDEVLLRFSVEGREAKLDAAVKACDSSTAAVLAFVKESGVEEKDVQSDFIAIHPQFPVDRGVESLVPSHFQASRGFAVRLRDVAKFDALLEGILKSGAHRVNDVEFRTTARRGRRRWPWRENSVPRSASPIRSKRWLAEAYGTARADTATALPRRRTSCRIWAQSAWRPRGRPSTNWPPA